MTFHAGNGITLTKEEENLPDEEREKVIQQKRDAQMQSIANDKNLDSDLKSSVLKGDAGAIQSENARLKKKLGGARDYGLGNVDGSKVGEAVDLFNQLDNQDIQEAQGLLNEPKAQNAASEEAMQETVHPTVSGVYASGNNEGFTQYRKERAARRAANAARQRAENEQREALLASGRYFDDGRGNIKLKTSERKYMTGDIRHRHMRTTADDGRGMMSIRDAGDKAWKQAIAAQQNEAAGRALNYTQSVVDANRKAAAERKQVFDESNVNSAKAKLSIFDGFAAALDALNADASKAKDNVVSVWGGRDEQGRDARWKYDSDGRVIGQADSRQVVRGKSLKGGGSQMQDGNIRKGFVDPMVLKTINAQLQKRGADYAITGIMAQQTYGAIGKPIEGSGPTFYVQGVRNDGTQFGQYMSIKDVYRWGIDNYRTANGEYGKAAGEAENFAINALGGYDPYGYRESQREAPSVEAARIRGENALALEEARQRGRVDLANLTGAQKKELQDMLLTAKKYGIAINAENALALEKMRQEGYDKRNASQEQVASLKTAAELMKDFDDVADELGLKGENREAFKTKLMNAFKETGVKEYAGGDAPAATPQEQVATPAAPTTTAVPKDNNQQAFRVLSQDEYRKLSAADQSKYFEALHAWKKSQAK